MNNFLINQQVLRILNQFYPTTLSADNIIGHPHFCALQTERESIIASLNFLVSGGFIIDTYADFPAVGHFYKIAHSGLLQITRRAKLDPVIWGSEAL